MQIQATACGLVGRLTESSCNHQPEVLQCKRKVSVSEPDPNHSIEVCLAGCTQAESYRLTCGIAGPAILLFDLCLASSLGRSLSCGRMRMLLYLAVFKREEACSGYTGDKHASFCKGCGDRIRPRHPPFSSLGIASGIMTGLCGFQPSSCHYNAFDINMYTLCCVLAGFVYVTTTHCNSTTLGGREGGAWVSICTSPFSPLNLKINTKQQQDIKHTHQHVLSPGHQHHPQQNIPTTRTALRKLPLCTRNPHVAE